MTPGIYIDMPASEYHAIEAISYSSHLKVLAAGTPDDLRESLQHEHSQSEAMNLGAAIHDRLLLPELFESQWKISGQCTATKGNGDPCENQGKVLVGGEWRCGVHGKGGEVYEGNVISPLESMMIERIAEKAAAHKYAQRLFAGDVQTELSLVWNDTGTGLLCKGRIDLYNPVKCALVDLKTTSKGISEDEFGKTASDMFYHLQLAHYLKGAQILGLKVKMVGWIAVSTVAPFHILPHGPNADDMRLSEMLRESLMYELSECLKSGEWPGYEARMGEVEIKPWKRHEIEMRIARVEANRERN